MTSPGAKMTDGDEGWKDELSHELEEMIRMSLVQDQDDAHGVPAPAEPLSKGKLTPLFQNMLEQHRRQSTEDMSDFNFNSSKIAGDIALMVQQATARVTLPFGGKSSKAAVIHELASGSALPQCQRAKGSGGPSGRRRAWRWSARRSRCGGAPPSHKRTRQANTSTRNRNPRLMLLVSQYHFCEPVVEGWVHGK